MFNHQKLFGFLKASNNSIGQSYSKWFVEQACWNYWLKHILEIFFGSQVPKLLSFQIIRDFWEMPIYTPGRGIKYFHLRRKETWNKMERGRKNKLGTFSSAKRQLICIYASFLPFIFPFLSFPLFFLVILT